MTTLDGGSSPLQNSSYSDGYVFLCARSPLAPSTKMAYEHSSLGEKAARSGDEAGPGPPPPRGVPIDRSSIPSTGLMEVCE